MVQVAIVCATGAVGREMVADLEACSLKDIQLGLFASARSAGERITFRDRTHEVQAFTTDLLKGYKYCLMSAGGAFSRQHSRALADMGVTVIDNSSAWRMVEGVPLVVPEVNPETLKNWTSGIIANPNCSTIQMVLPLQALHAAFGLNKVNVSTYQSVSGTGQKGIQELSKQIEAQFKYQDPVPSVYAQPIVFNVLPAIDVLDANGHCFEEEKMVRETRKIMNLPKLPIYATTVRVPVFQCHCESVTVELNQAVTRDKAMEVLEKFPGISLFREDSHQSFPTPRSTTGERDVKITRVRTPIDEKTSNTLQFWIVADNLKKGAATNAVQILELLSYH